LINKSEIIEILAELDIEPFEKFQSEFGCNYWYFKYHLLKDGMIEISKQEINNEYNIFFNGEDLNFISIQILDKENYRIKCIDGIFYIDIYNQNLLPIIKNILK
jgi:hypothetical protein